MTGNSINQVLASNLKYWMEQAEFTQSALADRAGVSQKTISNYLNPQQRQEGAKGKEPSAKLTELDKIAAALHISVWQLLREMTPRERKMYEAIERAYNDLHEEVVTTAADDAANQQTLRNASITASKKSVRKKAA